MELTENSEGLGEASEGFESHADEAPLAPMSYETLKGEVDQLRAELSLTRGTLTSTLNSVKVFEDKYNKEQDQKVSMVRASLLQQKKEAYSEGDYDKVVSIDENLRELDQIKNNAQAQPAPQQESGEFKQWASVNAPWYGVDKKKTAYAVAAAQELIEKNPELRGSGLTLLNKVLEDVNAAFPDKISRLREQQSKVSGGAKGAFSGAKDVVAGSHSFSDLPPEAKEACEKAAPKFIGQGNFKDAAAWKKYYVNQFFGDA